LRALRTFKPFWAKTRPRSFLAVLFSDLVAHTRVGRIQPNPRILFFTTLSKKKKCHMAASVTKTLLLSGYDFVIMTCRFLMLQKVVVLSSSTAERSTHTTTLNWTSGHRRDPGKEFLPGSAISCTYFSRPKNSTWLHSFLSQYALGSWPGLVGLSPFASQGFAQVTGGGGIDGTVRLWNEFGSRFAAEHVTCHPPIATGTFGRNPTLPSSGDNL